MKLLLDECVPRRLRRVFPGFEVFTIEAAGFKGLKNGRLLRAASADGFDVLITVDQNMRHQQNLKDLSIAIVIIVAVANRFEVLAPLVPDAIRAMESIRFGEIVIIEK